MGVDHVWCWLGVVLAQADLESVRGVGDAAVAGLLPDAGGVVLPGQMTAASEVVALDGSRGSCEPLGTARPGFPSHIALDLTHEDVEGRSPGVPEKLESVAVLVGLQDHVLARVVPTDHIVGLLVGGGREGSRVTHSVDVH